MQFDRQLVRCPHCKASVEMGRVHCTSCGEKMTGGKKPPKRIKQRDPNVRNPVVAVLKGLLTLALLGVIGLMLWPMESSHKPGAMNHARSYHNKINLAVRAASEGTYHGVELTEQEINGALSMIVQDQPEVGKTIPMSIETISVDIKKDTIIAYLNQKVWVIHLSYQFEMKPQAGEQGFDPEIVSAHLGHMPMVSALKFLVVNRFKKTLINLSQEADIMKAMTQAQVREDRMRFLLNRPDQ